MGAAVKQVGNGKRKNRQRTSVNQAKRERPYKGPLDRAAGWELVWLQVSPVFEAARAIVNPCYVYVIGEKDGPLKIGSAQDPIKRLRGLQTGNPRRLRIEYALVGLADTERLMHELWGSFAVRSVRNENKVDTPPGTEWFNEGIRPKLEPILKTAAEEQVKALTADSGTVYAEDMEHVIRLAHTAHGFVHKRQDEVRLLGQHGGYVIKRRSRI